MYILYSIVLTRQKKSDFSLYHIPCIKGIHESPFISIDNDRVGLRRLFLIDFKEMAGFMVRPLTSSEQMGRIKGGRGPCVA